MGKLLFTIVCFLLCVNTALAQVSQGTVSSKTQDGNGNKITSTVTGPSRGLDINCLAGCTAGGGATEATLLAFSNKFTVAYTDADAIVDQTTTAVHGQNYMFNGVTWDRVRGTIAGGLLVNISNASLAVTGSLGRTWVLASGTDSIAAVQSGTWNIGTVTTVTSITNPVAVTGTFFQAVQPVSQSGTWNINALTSITNPVAVTGTFWQATQPVSGTVAVSNAFLLDATLTARINTLGQKTMANSTPVVIASDQSSLPVTSYPTTASANNDGTCPNGAASFTVLASNASRTWAAIWASPANTDDVYIKLGGTATNADGRFAPGQALNFTGMRVYTGIIDAFPNSGTQAVCAMELN